MTAESINGRLEVKRACGNTLSSSSSNCLPIDVMEKAVRRLGWLSVFYAISIHAVHWSRHYGIASQSMNPYGETLMYVGLFGGTIAALLMALLTWTRKLSIINILEVGLVFEVVGAFCIGLMEHSLGPSIDQLTRGWSGIVVWTTFFVLVIPAPLGKTALAAISSVLMGPFTFLLYTVVYQQPLPDLGLAAVVFGPQFLFLLVAIVMSRFVYSLGIDLNKARAVGSYELVELLGRGGMGEVWKAKHRMLARPAALKVIPANAIEPGQFGVTTTALRRFEREAQATAALRSPNTVHIYDFGVTGNGSLYYAMELLDGLDLETLVKEHGPVPAERAIHFLLGISSSLEEAHSLGVIHRDIKPANVFASRLGIEYDFVKVLDFGLARFGNIDATRMTLDGVMSGTPAYMSPEAATGSLDIDGRADIYSLGCVAYWLLTGKFVFEAENALGMAFHHVNTAPVPPSLRTELPIPRDLERLIMDCLEKDRNRRPASIAEVARRLRAMKGIDVWSRDQAIHWWQTPEAATVSA
jgi:serine/threonine-protein kinase